METRERESEEGDGNKRETGKRYKRVRQMKVTKERDGRKMRERYRGRKQERQRKEERERKKIIRRLCTTVLMQNDLVSLDCKTFLQTWKRLGRQEFLCLIQPIIKDVQHFCNKHIQGI